MNDPAGTSIAAAEIFEFGSEMSSTLRLLLRVMTLYLRSSSFDGQTKLSTVQFSLFTGIGVMDGVGVTTALVDMM